jgi:UDP-N-acetyl-D-glucosamine dehydrogenase
MNKSELFVVVGLGYVGLPLALQLAKSGKKVIGIDTNIQRVNSLRSGLVEIEGVKETDLQDVLLGGKFLPTSTFEEISNATVIFICVPTPINEEREPDISILMSATKQIAREMSPGVLIIIESTVAPGTTRNFILPELERGSGFNRDSFKIAFSPERIDPANKNWRIENTPRLLAGYTKEAAELSREIYMEFIPNIFVCSSLEVAETAKLLENSFRYINISFINEISNLCLNLGINVNEVIEGAATKPYGFMPFYPSIGVGGHCIPVDPLYLSFKAREIGAPIRFIDLADQINQERPKYFALMAKTRLKTLFDRKILVVGVAYKPNVSDVRESAAVSLIKELKNQGARVYWHDELVSDLEGQKSVELSDTYDLAIIATRHSYLDLSKLGKVPVLDASGFIR